MKNSIVKMLACLCLIVCVSAVVPMAASAADFTIQVPVKVEALPQEYSGRINAVVEIYSQDKTLLAMGHKSITTQNGSFDGTVTITADFINSSHKGNPSYAPKLYKTYFSIPPGLATINQPSAFSGGPIPIPSTR